MNTSTKRAASVGVSLGAVAAIVAGSWAFASNVSVTPAEPAPTPTVVEEVSLGSVPADESADTIERRAAAEAERARIEAERLAAEAEAARLAAEAAAEAEAARIAAEQEAQRAAEEQTRQAQQSGGDTGGSGAAPSNPAPAPAPAPLKSCPGGLTAVEFDGAGNALGCMDPSCFTGEVAGDDPRCAVVRP